MHSLPEALNHCRTIELAANQPVFTQGQACENYIVLEQGQVKVFSRSADGRELVLYRIGAGEMCVLTTSCLLGNSRYPAEAVTEAHTKAYLLPQADFQTLLDGDREFRQFVFGNFSERLGRLMTQLEQITLESIDQRLARFLVEHSENHWIRTTHQEIADNIGSAREVVSRRLKALERDEVIRLHRGSVELLDEETLASRVCLN